MAILSAPYGKLLYCIIGYPKVKDYFPEFLITWDYKNEAQEILEKLERDAVELQRGIDEKNPALVGHAAKDPSFMNYLCSNCLYKEACDTMCRKAGELPPLEEAQIPVSAISNSGSASILNYPEKKILF